MNNKLKTVIAGAMGAWGMMFSVGVEAAVRSEIEVGVQDVRQNKPEAKFEEYRDVPQGLLLNRLEVDEDLGKSELSITGSDVGQETQSFGVSYKTGMMDLGLGWDQSVHRWSENARTLYWETSPGVYEVSDDISNFFQVNATSTAWWNNIGAYLANAHDQDLMIRRDKATAGGGFRAGNLYSNVNLSMEKKFGNQLAPLALGRNFAMELARSVDETVYDSSVSGGFAGRRSNVEFSFGLNLYGNDKDSITWDNMKRTNNDLIAPGGLSYGLNSARGRAAMQPDNFAHTSRITAGFDLTPADRISADVVFTRMEQNEKLLPYTINSSMTVTGSLRADNPANLPSERAEGVVNLWTQDYAWAHRSKGFSYGMKARAEQMANRSKEIVFAGHTQLDQTWVPTPEETVHSSYRKRVVSGYADWRVMSPLRLGVDYSKDDVTRSHREYAKSSEATWTGRMDYTPCRFAQMRGRYVHANRDAKDFEIEDYMSSPGTFAENPGLRRFDIASRVRNSGDLRLSSQSGPVMVGLNAALGHDKFKQGEKNLSNPSAPISSTNQSKMYGLLENRTAGWGLDASADLSETIDLSAYYQGGANLALQRQNQNTGSSVSQNAADDYTLNNRERYDVVGMGLGLAPLNDLRLQLGYDLSYSRGSTELSDLGSAVSTKLSLPETVCSKQDYSLKADYRVSPLVSFGAGYMFEIYNVKDFAQDNVPLATGKLESQTNVMLGDSALDYKAHVVTLTAKLKW